MNDAILSEARQTASAANARLSTGPRTEEGKARSSQNARKHGLTAAQLIIAAEDREEFEELSAQLHTDIRPEGALQQILFDQLVASAWNLRRIGSMEAELTASAKSYLDILDNPDLTAKLDRLARHQTRIERSFHRSLRELKSLQTDAALAPTLPPAFMQRVQPLASKRRLQNEPKPWPSPTVKTAPTKSTGVGPTLKPPRYAPLSRTTNGLKPRSPPALDPLHSIIRRSGRSASPACSDSIMILTEMIHDARIVRMNAQHLSKNIRRWMGDSVGHWEGDTLVIDTTNFTDKTRFRGSTENLHVVERLKRIDDKTLLYRFTVEDPETWDRPWTGEMTWPATSQPMLEYACQEGN
jgi:hypothetical protein